MINNYRLNGRKQKAVRNMIQKKCSFTVKLMNIISSYQNLVVTDEQSNVHVHLIKLISDYWYNFSNRI